MAKTESTAVNELISLVQGGSAPTQEPASDLFAEPVPMKVLPPARMTHTIPPMRGAGEVAPLPRGRAPQSTSSHSLSNAPPPPVRMTTASPARGTTIPPIGRGVPRPPTPNPDRTTHSSPTLASPRITRPSLPPPKPSTPTMPAPRSTAPSLPALRTTPRATLPPAAVPDVDIPIDVSPFAAEPQQYPVVQRTPSVDLTADVIRGDNWFEVSAKVEKLHEETWVGQTDRSRKSLNDYARMLAVPAIVAASIGVAVGVYISYRGTAKPTPHATAPLPAPAASPEEPRQLVLPVTGTAPDPNAESANSATASAGGGDVQPPTKEEDAAKQKQAAALATANVNDPAAEPALTKDAPVHGSAQPAVAAAAPAVREIQTSHGVVKLADVRIDSKPSGATVMLVDDGKTSFLGKTPLATSVDASKSYDVILTLEGRPAQMAHLDPATSAKLFVELHHAHHASGSETPVVAEKPAADKPVADKPAGEKKVADKPASEQKSAKPAFDEAAELASLGEKPKAGASGEGTLMVSSKPPCDIFIDGKATGLTTPQRSISLSAGTHKITLVNQAEGIKKTLPVQISADKPTKLIQDLMAK